MTRLFDIVFALIALTIFLIPICIISLFIKFKEKHPIFFKQERVGLKLNNFSILKFQTLVNEVPTPTGKFLRKTGLDEIPQFINVLKGDMSLVGPRALTNYDIKRLGWDNDYYIARWQVKPGITGLAQIYGGQNKKTSWFWDNKYIQKNNIFCDLMLVIISFAMNLFGKIRIRNIIWQKKGLR